MPIIALGDRDAAKIIPEEREAFLKEHGSSAETLVKKLDEKLKSLEHEGTNPHIIGLWKHLQQQARASDCTELINKRVQGILLNADEKSRYEAYLQDESMKDFRGRTEIALRHAAAAAKDTELQKEKINEALVNMLTPKQLASLAEQSRQEFRDKYNDPRKMAATTLESEIQRLEALAKQRSLTLAEKEGLAAVR